MSNDDRPLFNPDIQGLRGIAVLLVLAFHLWPGALPGGYVGVDVFFVISGFLITRLLVDTQEHRGLSALCDFYTRRMRRLLPTALLVLFASFVGSLLFLSKARWVEIANQTVASALYVQNWRLAHLAVSYLDADSLPTPVQHYWSLSIEEQFYAVWPLLIGATIWLSRRFGRSPRVLLAAALGLVFAVSLGFSIAMTRSDPAFAYFATHTRLWELALGGLLSLAPPGLWLGRGTAMATTTLGTAAIIACSLWFSAATPFPGAFALIPTLAAALVVRGRRVHGSSSLLAFKPLRFVGDRSYSIYLWHWPLITFFKGQHFTLTPMGGVSLAVIVLILSDLSYRFVEERYRHPRPWPDWRPLIYGTVALCACVAVSFGLRYSLEHRKIDLALIGTASYPGPAALLAGAPVPSGVEPMPPLAMLNRDVSIASLKKCHQNFESAEPIACVLGDAGSSHVIVVAGDSHAGQWIAAFAEIARRKGLRLVTFTKAACPLASVAVEANGRPYPICAEWREAVIQEINKLRPEMIFVSQSNYPNIPREAMIRGLVGVWDQLTATGAHLVAIRNTPALRFDPGDCLASKPDACVVDRRDAEAVDLLGMAVAVQGKAHLVDMNDAICGPGSCSAVVGNIIVWRDNHHLTATYARALAPYLAEKAGLGY